MFKSQGYHWFPALIDTVFTLYQFSWVSEFPALSAILQRRQAPGIIGLVFYYYPEQLFGFNAFGDVIPMKISSSDHRKTLGGNDAPIEMNLLTSCRRWEFRLGKGFGLV